MSESPGSLHDQGTLLPFFCDVCLLSQSVHSQTNILHLLCPFVPLSVC